MKTLLKKSIEINNQTKINSTVKFDKELDKIKDLKFKSNYQEEVKNLNFKLSFL